MDKNKRINQYQENYLNQYGFEERMVKYRRRLVMEKLSSIRPRTVIEVGCGSELLYQHYYKAEGAVEHWIIVEPGDEFCNNASTSKLPNLVVIQGFFEEMLDQIKCHLPEPPDVIIISGVLHEVPSPLALLNAARSLMGLNSILHVNVPNANSIHRLLAKSMGLIQNVKTLSERNRDLLQHRVYDAVSLRADIEECGLSVVCEGGYLVKPFTHMQMQLIAPQLGEVVLDGLFQLGKDCPDIASEIYLEARKK